MLGLVQRNFVPLALVAGSLVSSEVQAAVLPPQFVNAVVAIGHTEGSGANAPWFTEGSGFFYGFLATDDPDPAKKGYEVFLVTNRHVVAGKNIVSIRLNPKNSADPGQVFTIPGADWFFHSNASEDIAVAKVNWQILMERGIDVRFFPNDSIALSISRMGEIGLSAGDGVFVLGFPMNLAGAQRNYVIVRRGAVARVSDLMESASQYMLVDANIFPGNSGGPVILEPTDFAISGTKRNNTAFLLGVVRAYIPYSDLAVSQQTQHQRIVFEENSGLAEVVPMDRVNEAIQAWKVKQSSPTGPLKPAPH